jgi:drug/metabolite transporter (DMT)-like permease
MSQPAGIDWRVILAFAIVYVVWGSTYLAIHILIQSVPPFASAAARFTVAGLVLLLFARATGRRVVAPAHEMRALVVIGLLLLVGGNGLVVWAMQEVPSGVAALLVATLPLWIVTLETLLPSGERVPAIAWLGVVLGLVGLTALLSPKLAAGGFGELHAELVMLGAPLSWAIGSLYAKRRPLTLSPLAATGWEMLFAGLIFCVIAAGLGEFARFAPTREGWLALAYLIFAGSCMGLTAFVWLLQHIAPSKVVTYAYVNPVIAVFLGWLLAGEPFTPAMALGTPIIVIAVVLVTSARSRSEERVMGVEPIPRALPAPYPSGRGLG